MEPRRPNRWTRRKAPAEPPLVVEKDDLDSRAARWELLVREMLIQEEMAAKQRAAAELSARFSPRQAG